MTAEQNRANLRSAERVVAIQLGIDDQGGTWRTSLTYEQRVAYDKALAAYIAAHPSAFADSTVETAQLVTSQNLTPLADASFSLEDFSSAVVDNAVGIGDSVANVGRGVTNTLSLAKWGIPLAVLVLVVGFLWKRVK